MSPHRPGLLRGGAAVLAALAALPFLAACGGATSAAAGDVVPGRGEAAGGTATTVLLPAGSLEMTVGEVVAGELPGARSEDGEVHEAPGDGGFLPLTYTFDPFADVPGRAILARDPQPARIRVAVDETTVDLPEPYQVAGQGTVGASTTTVYVAAGVTDPDVEITVAYDGLTQSVDPVSGEVEPGAAAPLYEPSTSRKAACATRLADAADVRARVSCDATVEDLPYVPGTGWAEEGEVYVAVGYRLRVDDLTGYEVAEPAEVTSRLGSQTPLPDPGPGEEAGAADSPEEVTSIDIFTASAGSREDAEVDARFGVVPRGDSSSTPEPLLVQARIATR